MYLFLFQSQTIAEVIPFNEKAIKNFKERFKSQRNMTALKEHKTFTVTDPKEIEVFGLSYKNSK
jgi:hypothetical protein